MFLNESSIPEISSLLKSVNTTLSVGAIVLSNFNLIEPLSELKHFKFSITGVPINAGAQGFIS